MDTEQNHNNGWDDATGTFPSTGIFSHDDSNMQGWGNDDLPEDPEEMQRRWATENRQDPYDYTPWIAALPMPFTKEIEQGLSLRTQALEATTSRSKEEPLVLGCSKKACLSSQRPKVTCGDACKHPAT